MLFDGFQQSLASVELVVVLLGLLYTGLVLLHRLGFFLSIFCIGAVLLFFRIGTTGDKNRNQAGENDNFANAFHAKPLLFLVEINTN